MEDCRAQRNMLNRGRGDSNTAIHSTRPGGLYLCEPPLDFSVNLCVPLTVRHADGITPRKGRHYADDRQAHSSTIEIRLGCLTRGTDSPRVVLGIRSKASH